MKEYIKPSIEFIDLRSEERLAVCLYVRKNKGQACPVNLAKS